MVEIHRYNSYDALINAAYEYVGKTGCKLKWSSYCFQNGIEAGLYGEKIQFLFIEVYDMEDFKNNLQLIVTLIGAEISIEDYVNNQMEEKLKILEFYS